MNYCLRRNTDLGNYVFEKCQFRTNTNTSLVVLGWFRRFFIGDDFTNFNLFDNFWVQT